MTDIIREVFVRIDQPTSHSERRHGTTAAASWWCVKARAAKTCRCRCRRNCLRSCATTGGVCGRRSGCSRALRPGAVRRDGVAAAGEAGRAFLGHATAELARGAWHFRIANQVLHAAPLDWVLRQVSAMPTRPFSCLPRDLAVHELDRYRTRRLRVLHDGVALGAEDRLVVLLRESASGARGPAAKEGSGPAPCPCRPQCGCSGLPATASPSRRASCPRRRPGR